MWYDIDRIPEGQAPAEYLGEIGRIFTVFDEQTQDSGNISWGLEVDGEKYFVKSAGMPTNDKPVSYTTRLANLKNAIQVRGASPSRIMPTMYDVIESDWGSLLVYEWVSGELLRRTADPNDAYRRFLALPKPEIIQMLTKVYKFHADIGKYGWVANDFYDGCFLYDFESKKIRLMDFDHYQPRPFINQMGRMFGSSRFMAPEEFQKGATIDQRTTVFNMGRAGFVFLADGSAERENWSASSNLYHVLAIACAVNPAERFQTLEEFVDSWKNAAKINNY